jgi:serine/threonine-protein kinase
MAAQTVRPGLAALQQAHHNAVIEQAESQRRVSEAESWHERRARLFSDARRALTAIAEELRTALTEAAPSITTGSAAGELLILELGNARLNISEPTEVKGSQEEHRMPFTVIAYAEIALLAPGSHGYRGRSHSLWYCDLEEEGRFAWYELAFMNSPLLGQMSTIAPFCQSPVEGAVAIQPVMGTKQLAWTPTKVVPGEIEGFVVRWGQWMGAACNGQWAHPSRLPEHDIVKRWRGQ